MQKSPEWLPWIELRADGYNVSKSLRSLIRSQSYPEIHYGIKLIGGNLGYAEQIYSFPHFCACLLNRFLQNRNPDTTGFPA